MCGKDISWKEAKIHPHSHTTPILTRHQLDHFQEIQDSVGLFYMRHTAEEIRGSPIHNLLKRHERGVQQSR